MGLWWSVALSEEVTAQKPLNVDLGEQPLVLWRDNQGIARALEDRCPHRRAPLSLGCIRDNGLIQCGYHGWSYDGETGRLREIPNMKDEQRFPPIYKALAFPVVEAGGFVKVSLTQGVTAPDAGHEEVFPLSGTTHVALAQHAYLDALFDDPSLLIDVKGVDFTSYLLSELRPEDGMLVMERACQWGRLHLPAYATADFPISFLTRTHPETGETDFALRDADFNILLEGRLSIVPGGRGVTQVRWRAKATGSGHGLHARRLARGTPITVKAAVDAAALRTLKPSVSTFGHALRRDIGDKMRVSEVASAQTPEMQEANHA